MRGSLNRRGPLWSRWALSFWLARFPPAVYFRVANQSGGGKTKLQIAPPPLNRWGPLWEQMDRHFLTCPVSTSGGILGVMLFLAFCTQFFSGPLHDFWGRGKIICLPPLARWLGSAAPPAPPPNLFRRPCPQACATPMKNKNLHSWRSSEPNKVYSKPETGHPGTEST